MNLMGEGTSFASPFSHECLEKLAALCSDFYQRSFSARAPEVRQRRIALASYIRKFHEECGTLTPYVSEAIRKLEDSSCLLLMTAHQPNLFAYGGVLRKATLNHVLAQKLSDSLKVPIVGFFGVADQDFTDDRWVRSALLPDVYRRDGSLGLRFDMPKKLMLNKVARPSREILQKWRSTIEDWMESELRLVARDSKSFGLQYVDQGASLTENFEIFWRVVEEAYERAERYADFNAFVMSWIVNRVWGYETLFSRFSECQQIFEPEFRFLLSRFDEYSRYVREATVFEVNSEAGVYEREFETAPFWYHCSCGGKARVKVGQTDGRLIGEGRCVRCDREYLLGFGSKADPQISEFVNNISARGISVPLVFFKGLDVGCYVGGIGGSVYLRQASYIAEHLGTPFPPVAVWRPKDEYLGVGQLEALMVYRKLSGTFDFSRCPQLIDDLREKIVGVQGKIEELEAEKSLLGVSFPDGKEECVESLKVLSARQSELRKEADFSVMVRNVRLLENVVSAMELHPCIVDYAVNVGLKATGEQWVAFLWENGSLLSNVKLSTPFDAVGSCIRSCC